jgi:pimeloyl-ACP methyl ester carboxylesterase
MPAFSAHDGTKLAYHVFGDGPPVVCLPGGPMQDSVYLGDLGGLSAHRQLIMLDPRGTGQSAIPEDAASYRCDRLVDDVDSLREHLGLDRMDLLAHSAGANLAALYVARQPERVGKLALITPSVVAVGITITGDGYLRCRGCFRPGHHPCGARTVRLAGPAAGWGGRSEFSASRDGRFRRAVSARQAGH